MHALKRWQSHAVSRSSSRPSGTRAASPQGRTSQTERPPATTWSTARWAWTLLLILSLSGPSWTGCCPPPVVVQADPLPLPVRPVRPQPRATVPQLKAWALAAAQGDGRAALLLVDEVLSAWDYEDALAEGGAWEGR